MSNSYNSGHQWDQNQINFGPLQLEQDYDFGPISGPSNNRSQQMGSYTYSQQQLPPNSSSLHGAFSLQPNQQPSHSRSSSFGAAQAGQTNQSGGYLHGVYGSQPDNSVPATSSASYRTNPTTFNFSGSTSTLQGIDRTHPTQKPVANFLNSSPAAAQLSFSQPPPSNSYYPGPSGGSLPQPKRHHSQAFKEDLNQEDPDGEIVPDQKDGNKSKLSRACARCKNLKVRCEAKTETEPCKRCFNGGHECVIPGRKIRRTPPKREHLLNQIHAQAKEIERLMLELEKLSSKQTQTTRDQIDILQSPVLSPTSTSESFFAGSDVQPGGADGFTGSANANNTAVNKAVEDWIAKARDHLHEFGAFVGIGGAGMPKRYLVDEDLEGSDSGEDEEYLDVQEDFINDDDRYELAVEDPDGEEMMVHEGEPVTRRLHYKSSNSSIGGANLPRKRSSDENSKPANLPVEASPFGLFGKLSLKNPRSRGGSVEPDEEDKGFGIVNENFFKSVPAPNALGRRLQSAQHQAPAILTRGIISPQEAEKLFKIYFDNMNLSLSLLDPILYTAQRTFYRSPFLFTVICAISSRFYSERPDLYPKAMHFAQLAAGTALISGNKNVEMCQAYILLSLYPVTARKWEDQRSWLYLGLAIRVATDLNLHLPTTAKPLNENHAREMLNRTRVWINCFNLDRSTGSQYGKPPIINPRDYIANHSENWWSTSPYNMQNFDIHICAYNAELRVMAAFIVKIYSDPDHPTGLNTDIDFEGIATATDDELKALGDKWFLVLQQTDMSDPQNCFRTGLLRLAYSYSRLIALSYGFQHAFGKTDGVDENPFLMRCLRAASDVVGAVVDDICRPSQLHYFRHGPEAQSVFVTFASAFLVKLLQPKFASYLAPEKRVEIRGLVQKVINLLGSPAVAIDDRHGPKLYSRFLEKLLAKPMARLDSMSPAPAANAPLPRVKQRRPKSSGQTSDSAAGAFEIPSTVYNHPSPATSSSLSPPPTEAALSFDTFAPIGGAIDPFAPESSIPSMSVHSTSTDGTAVGGLMMAEEFFQPPLPFDDHIVQSLQSLTDPSGWQDISLPGFNWMTQFQQNFDLDLNNPALYDQNMNYMTGPVNSGQNL